jgi:DNA polymerase V
MLQTNTTNQTSVDICHAITQTALSLPCTDSRISAGFPSPAMDFTDKTIDLNEYLIKHPAATFFGRVKGDSLKNAGIEDGDLLIIDRSLEPMNGKIAVCYLDGEFTAKRIKKHREEVWLMPENENYPPIKMQPGNELIIWGIVTYVIKAV